MILALGSAADDTFMYSVAALRRRRVDVHVVDLVHLVMSGEIDLRLQDLSESRICLPEETLALADVSGFLSRLIDLASAAPSHCVDRSIAMLQSLGMLLNSTSRPVVNPPSTDASNASKMVHEVLVGESYREWKIPETVVTNDPAALEAFRDLVGPDCIIKGVSAAKTWVRPLTPVHVRRLVDGVATPILVQRRIVGADVRVHVVGDRCFAELIRADKTDYRNGAHSQFSPIDLPSAIATGCVAVTQSLGLALAGIDFKIEDRTGDWFWLEANSSPCYEGYDRRAGGQISEAIVDHLTSRKL